MTEYTKADLTNKILAARKELDAALARLGGEQMLLVILHGEWSVKDLLGHLGFWEGMTVSRFNTLHGGGVPEPVDDMDALNAKVLSESRQRSLDEVRASEKEAFEKLVAMVDAADHDELFRPGYFAWAKGNPFVSWIAGNTWGHYEEHLPELIAWLEENP